MKNSNRIYVFLVTLLVLFINEPCLCQKDKKIDSLKSELQKVINDTTKVNVLNSLSEQLWRKSQYEESLKYSDDGLILAERIKYKKGIADATYNRGQVDSKRSNNKSALKTILAAYHLYEEIGNKKRMAVCKNSLGVVYKNISNYEDAIKNYLEALYIFSDVGDKKNIATINNNLANVYSAQGKKEEALKMFFAALNVYKEINDKQGMGSAYNNIGITFLEYGNFPDALENIMAALKLREETGDQMGIAAAYGNIAIINIKQGNYPEGLKNTLSSIKIEETIGDKMGLAFSYDYMGTIYSELANYVEAENNYNASLKIWEEIGDKIGMSSIYNNRGNIFYRQGKYSEALKSYKAAFEIYSELNEKNGMASALTNIGTIYSDEGNFQAAQKNLLSAVSLREQTGDKTGMANSIYNIGHISLQNNNPIEANKYLDRALAISKELGIKKLIKSIYRDLVDVDTQLGYQKQALEHYKLYTLYKDSLLNEGNSKMIAEMKAKYETEKKDKEIHQLESEKQISSLQLLVQQESLNRIQTEKAKIHTENLYNIQQVELLSNEQKLQQLDMERNQADLIAQKAETDRKQDQLVILNKEGEIQKLEIKKQTLFKNYLIGGLILFCVLAFFVYNNYSTRQKLKLQTLRNKIASDLHDDVGSTLSSISIFSQIAQEQSKEVIPLLDTIGESSRKMLDAMGDIVWTINPENDQFEMIILRMRSFAYELLGAKGIDFEFNADEDIAKIKLPMEVRKNLYLIFKEATNNLVKYAGASKAMFAIKGEKDNLSMMIRDNGKGFDMNSSTQGNGLKNMKKRAEEIGAKFIIDSYPGGGTTIQLKIAV